MRFSGKIGVDRGSVETSPGVYEDTIEEIFVIGTIRSVRARWSNMGSGSPTASHILSIIAPEESTIDINEVVYVWWKDRRWSVVSVAYLPPRVELSLGGQYNG